MSRLLRYTGRFPPRKLWDRFPNWTLALDEEGRRGQDETTLRPSDRQDTIDRSVTWTAGEVRLAGATLHRRGLGAAPEERPPSE